MKSKKVVSLRGARFVERQNRGERLVADGIKTARKRTGYYHRRAHLSEVL